MQDSTARAGQLSAAVAVTHLLAQVAVFGTRAVGALAPFAAALGPIVGCYLAAFAVFGLLSTARSRSDPPLGRLAVAVGLATAATTFVALWAQASPRRVPAAVVLLGGALTFAAVAFLFARSARPVLLLSGASSLVALALAEAFLGLVHDPLDPRVFVPKTPYAKYRELLVEDPELGFRLRPGAHVSFESEERDYYRMDVRINAIGLRDVEYERRKPAGVRRIVFAGDSIVFGAGVQLEQTIPKLLEQRLNAGSSGGLRYQVMNWGVGSYSLSQELGLFRRLDAEGYRPDLILVGTSPNDFGQSLRPHTYRSQTGLIATEENQARFAGGRHGLLPPRTERLARFWIQRLAQGADPSAELSALAASDAARSTRDDLAAFRDYAARAGLPLAFVLFPSRDLVEPGVAPARSEAVYASMRDALERTGVPYLDCRPAVRRATQELGRLYVRWDDVHFDARGAGIVAEAAAGFVRELAPRAPEP